VCRKASFVNFQGQWNWKGQQVARVPAPEFRQHDGVLYWPGLEIWILFVTELMKLAERYARGESSCPVLERDEATIDMLFEEMGFPWHGREYFHRRMAWFALPSKRRGNGIENGAVGTGETREAQLKQKRGEVDDARASQLKLSHGDRATEEGGEGSRKR
jgi:hypothetical protein